LNVAEVFQAFPSEADCIIYLERVRWHGKPRCPYCRDIRSTLLTAEYRHHCNTCNTTYSVTVGTIFHHTHLPLQKWFLAISLVLNVRRGISGRKLALILGVNRNTACSMITKIRNAMGELEQRKLLDGLVETHEVFKMTISRGLGV
jgi:transposase-like protein